MVEEKQIARKRVAKFILLSFLFLIVLVMFLTLSLGFFIKIILTILSVIFISFVGVLISRCISILIE
jgi:hypothetical protein|tara:strand:- start:241 stop:441 length:201 start_codon:yes stop_codon:yes gene_type:complete